MSVKTFFSRAKTFVNTHVIFRVLAAILAFAISAWLIWGVTEFLGNPIMFAINKSNAEKYLAENYGGEGYYVKSVSFDFKFGVYAAVAVKPESDDFKFAVFYGKDGSFRGDDYENRIKNGDNTRFRLQKQYGDFVNSVLRSAANPYSTGVCYGELVFEGDYDEWDFGISKSILKPDGLYDTAKLGAEGGLIHLTVNSEQASPERAAEILLDIDNLARQGGLEYYAIDFSLKTPDNEYYSEYYSLNNFRRADIYEEGLVDRINKNRQKTQDYYDKIDKEKT